MPYTHLVRPRISVRIGVDGDSKKACCSVLEEEGARVAERKAIAVLKYGGVALRAMLLLFLLDSWKMEVQEQLSMFR